MTDTLRVCFEDETDPTWPDSWGWSSDEIAEYMQQVERGDFVVLMARVEHLCPECGDWHDSHRAYLSDIHVSTDDLYPRDRNGRLNVVTYDDIPAGPSWWGPDTPSNAATGYTPAPNYLLNVAADLLAEAST